MADRDLQRIERVGRMRNHAEKVRFVRTRRHLDEAMMLRQNAEQRCEAEAEAERDLIRQCYADPACEQAWVVRALQAERVQRSKEQTELCRQQEAELALRKEAAAKAIVRGDARLGAIRAQLAALRLSAARSTEDISAQERQDGTWGRTKA